MPLIDLLEQVRTRYAHAARMGNDLMTRLDALDAERMQWEAALREPDVSARARMELSEIGQLRPRIDRTARTWVDRARGIELIVASCLIEATTSGRAFVERPLPAPERVHEGGRAGHNAW